jgi:deazaflavin-dependent oxidoreductase (nitroreductase family)
MATGTAKQAPSFVERFNPLVQRLVRLGLPMGPTALITIRGRKTGEERTTPVSIIEIEGRRWVQSPFGDVNWVLNLRAAGQARLKMGRQTVDVRAVELSRPERIVFYRDILGPFVRRLLVGPVLVRILGMPEVLKDPVEAADRHPAFELLVA